MGYQYDYYSPYGYGGREVIDVGRGYNGYASGIVLLLLTALLVYEIIVWVFRSVGLYHMAKDRGIAHAWFAWVPVLSDYILGRLINNKVVLGDSIVLGHAEFFLPFISFLGLSSSTFGKFSSVIMAAVWVYNISALWRLYKIYRPKNRTSYTIWSAIIGSGFFIFAIRNDKPFDPLEPNKVYQNFYGEKKIVQDNYRAVEDNVKAQEETQLEDLKEAYDRKMENPALDLDQQAQLHKDYRMAKERIEEAAETVIEAEMSDEQRDIEALEKSMVPETDESDAVNRIGAEDSQEPEAGNSTIELTEIENIIVTPPEESVADEPTEPIYSVDEISAEASEETEPFQGFILRDNPYTEEKPTEDISVSLKDVIELEMDEKNSENNEE